VKPLVEYLAKSLVEHPQAVQVEERPGDGGSVIELIVAKEDLGRVIGKQGRTIKAIRHLLTVAAAKAKTKVTLVVQE
jgi:uncharacterized protein